MGFKKYVKDYRNEYIIKPDGKPGMVAVYTGKYFRFLASEDELKKARISFAVLTSLSIVLAAIPLFFKSVGASSLYVALPHVIAFFPLVHILLGVGTFWHRTPPLIREFNDKIKTRITVSSVLSMIILGATAIAEAVNCVMFGFPINDIIYFLLLAASAAASGFIFFKRKVLETEECDEDGNPKTQE